VDDERTWPLAWATLRGRDMLSFHICMRTKIPENPTHRLSDKDTRQCRNTSTRRAPI
jgi:hypothetical protein